MVAGQSFINLLHLSYPTGVYSISIKNTCKNLLDIVLYIPAKYSISIMG